LPRAILVAADVPIAAGVLRGMLEAGIEIAEIWGARSGRRTIRLLAPSWSVSALAQRHGLRSVRMPDLKDQEAMARRISQLSADLLVTAITLQIIPAHVLTLFGRQAVNFHPALLPDYRGPTPVHAMLLDGTADRYGGMTLHVLSPKIDEGPIVARRAVPRGSKRYFAWRAELAGAARVLARDALPKYLSGNITATPQSAGSYRNLRKQMNLGPETERDEAIRVVAALGDTRSVRVGRTVIGPPVVAEGSPTGRPEKDDGRFVTFDVADARLRFRRYGNLDKLRDGWTLIRALRAIDRQE
jgi:methionyl-tRNA formyltransferase